MSFQIKEDPILYDVVIVGSGAGGGMAAYELTKAGANVCMLEAGGFYDPGDSKFITQLKKPWDSPRRGAASKFRSFGDFDAAWGGWQLEGEPYTQKEGTDFWWFRSRMLGGRTNHWGRISLRFGPKDFKRKSIDGLGEDWPISYEDIAPYYDRVDKLIGVFGTKEGLPDDPDSIYLRPPKPRLHELKVMEGNKKTGVLTIPSRLSILTESINDERGQCFYCKQCNRGCQAYADFSSSSVLVKPAMKTGKLKLINDAMAREVLTDDNGKATGVSYVDKISKQEYAVKGKVVILAASACESARMLLNSKTSRFQNGVGNSSGVVGKYLHDSTGADRMAFVPSMVGRKRYNEDGVGGLHVYSPWWLDNAKLDFPRGYHIEYWGGMSNPSYGFGFGMEKLNGKYPGSDGKMKPAGGYGATLKEDHRHFYGSYIGMSGRGESVASANNYCEIDPNTIDKWGIPVLRFNYQWSDYEIKQAKHMQDTFEEVIDGFGGIPVGDKPGADSNYGLTKPGQIIHEVGTVRMGNDPATSALNSNCQSHDVKNLFCVDGGAFASQADKNPTWTILALSMKASDFIINKMKSGGF